MPIAKNQRPTTMDEKHHQRYCALSAATGRLVSMATMQRAAHNLYLDTFDIQQRVLTKQQSQGIYLTEVGFGRKLLYAEFYRDELTIIK